MALPYLMPLSAASPDEILLPARPWFIVLTLVLALFANLLPLSGVALTLRPDFLALPAKLRRLFTIREGCLGSE